MTTLTEADRDIVDYHLKFAAEGTDLLVLARALDRLTAQPAACTGCGLTLTIDQIKAGGYLSCCPERNMQPVKPAAGLVDREKLARLISGALDRYVSADSDGTPTRRDYYLTDALIASGLIRPMPTREEIAEELADTPGSWMDLADAILALMKEPT